MKLVQLSVAYRSEEGSVFGERRARGFGTFAELYCLGALGLAFAGNRAVHGSEREGKRGMIGPIRVGEFIDEILGRVSKK